MKKKLLSLAVIALSLYSSTAFAKIWRVNNNQGVSADFTELQAAHDGAASGDTLHLESSPTSYGGLNATKKIIIIGPGYFLDQNPETHYLKQTAKVGGITFNTGSNGSEIGGVELQSSAINIFANDIIVKRNRFSHDAGPSNPDYYSGSVNVYYINGNGAFGASNILITQNYGLIITVNYSSNGILILNNFITRPGYEADNTAAECLNLSANTVAIVKNNIFNKGKLLAYNTNFTNNILVKGFFEGTGNLTSNNLANESQFGTANNNKANINMTDVFVGAGEGVSRDGQWKLAGSSPAIRAGYGSTAQNPVDAGIFGGTTPYVLSGQPAAPVIYSFENEPIGSNADPLSVTIKVKSNP